MWLAAAFSGEAVANGQNDLLSVHIGAKGVALTSLAIGFVSRFSQGQRISVESGFTLIAIESGRVVNAPKALSGLGIAIADGVGINIVVAFTFLARPDRPIEP